MRRIQHTKAGKRFHPTLGVSYSRIRDVIKAKFGRFFEDPRQLGTHSLRFGGISDPGCQSLPGEMLQRHGGWKTVASKNKYIQPSNATLLKVVRVWQFNEFVSIKIPSQYLLTFLPNEIYRIIASTRARPSGVPSRRPPELSCPKYIGWFFLLRGAQLHVSA